MDIVTTSDEVRAWSGKCHEAGKRVGFVPTMGYLHEGHLSLIDLARNNSDSVVVSIFVNPTQFDRKSDLDTYPRDHERDLRLCRERGVELVYMPDAGAMYPEGYSTWVTVDLLGDHLCGASRPGHFRGVTTVVTKLLNTVRPDMAVFGRKDAQQARIIQRMTADLDFGIKILLGDIVREEDGLALSSRNVRLAPEHRAQAPAIHAGLLKAREKWEQGERNANLLIDTVENHIRKQAPTGRVDYVELVDWRTLAPVDPAAQDVLLAAAVFFGDVRLIDNELLLEE